MRRRPELRRYVRFEAALARITKKAVAESVEEIAQALNEQLRHGQYVPAMRAFAAEANPIKRYPQPCFDHEYITSDCPDCGKLA